MKGIQPYIRVSEDLERKVLKGQFDEAGRLPAETELTRTYGVARMTIRHAIDQLVKQGLVVRRQGSGTYLTGHKGPSRSLDQLLSLHEEMAAEGFLIDTRIILLAEEPPSTEVAEKLGLTGENRAIRVKRLRLSGGWPMAVQESWIPYFLCPSLTSERELVEGSLYRTLLERYGVRVAWADQAISAVAADSELAALLDVDIGSPLLHIERVTHDSENNPVEVGRGWMQPGHRMIARVHRS